MVSLQDIYHILLHEFPYFKRIDEMHRQKLCQRTKEFMDGTSFSGRADFEITDRVRILISACSQQLTLGFKQHYEYAYFEKVLVYPAKYYSSYTQRYHVGEMNTAGVIVLSWEDFYKGISDSTDAHNVGLHEFAHALEYLDISNKPVDKIFSACLDKLTALAGYYMHHQPKKPLFRSYATVNLSEFFAVATEYYFEAPLDFAEQEPEIFDLLKKAYQQNTAPAAAKPEAVVHAEDKLVFGAYNKTLNTLIQCGGYTVSLAALLVLTVLGKPVPGVMLMAAGFFFTYRHPASKKQFTIYQYHVRIHLPFFRRIFSLLTADKTHTQTRILYTDVLYLCADDYTVERSNTLFQQEREGFGYTLCYWQRGKLRFAEQTSGGMDVEKLLRYLYLKKKVGTRLNGNYRKYKEG